MREAWQKVAGLLFQGEGAVRVPELLVGPLLWVILTIVLGLWDCLVILGLVERPGRWGSCPTLFSGPLPAPTHYQ